MALREPQAVELAHWLRERLGAGAQLCSDSRKVRPGDAFLAYPGERSDGRTYVASALAAGAAAVLVEAQGAHHTHGQGSEQFSPSGTDGVTTSAAAQPDIALRAVTGLKSLCGAIASSYYGHPSDALEVVAVTGTNGKTSCTQWIAQGLQSLGQPCAVIGTLGAGLAGSALQDFGLTTPDALELQTMFAQLRDRGEVPAVAIEASSIGLLQYRLSGTRISVAVFTNLTRDHLDVHCTMQSYAQAKARLFGWPGLRAAVINLDDPWAATMLQALPLEVPCIGTSMASNVASALVQAPQPEAAVGTDLPDPVSAALAGRAVRRLVAHRIEQTPTGLTVALAGDFGEARFSTRLIGLHNVANLLSVCATWLAMGHALADCIAVLEGLQPVAGRLQPVAPNEADPAAPPVASPLVLVDYAHTPDALEQALRAIEPLARAREGAVWCVFGAGGDRDPGKRPEMARVVQARADHVVVTSDNPRSEDPLRIIDDILAGLSAPPALCEADRATAIGWAIERAQDNDLILLAGKGHEPYQEIAGQRIAFSDIEQARQALARRHSTRRDAPTAVEVARA